MESQEESDNEVTDAKRKVGCLLALGIALLPGIFVWFLLRKGHSVLARIIGFTWAAFLAFFTPFLIGAINSPRETSDRNQEQGVEEVASDSDASESEPPVTKTQEPEAPAEPAQPAMSDEERRGMHCLNGWDGSHWKMQGEIKRRLRDPDSFEHIETRITPIDEVGNHSIFMTFRARNGFGGMNVDQAIGVVDNKECELQTLQVL